MGLSMTPWRLPDPTRWQLSTCRVGSNIVDAQLNPPDSVFTVIMNSAEASGEPRVIIRSAVRQPYAAPIRRRICGNPQCEPKRGNRADQPALTLPNERSVGWCRGRTSAPEH
jgi:hypothetical protein